MSTEATTPEAPAQEPETASVEAPAETEAEQAEETDWKAEARKWEQRAKAKDKAAEKAAEKARLDAMDESERAVAEAEERGRAAAASEFGQELAKERFDALAGRRNPDFDTAKALEYVDLSKLLGEDGRPDAEVIAAAVDRLVPAVGDPTPSFDGGTRTPPPVGVDMNTALRKATGRA